MYFNRYLQDRLISPVSRHKVRLLLGARQTGKTALLRHLLSGERAVFYDMQEVGLRRRFETDPAAFSREVRALSRSVRAVVVDEVQKVPALLDEVQALHDAAPRQRQFFLTGSSARQLRARSANLLPGRSHGLHLFPVCGWEQVDASELHIPSKAVRPNTAASPPPFPAQTLTRTLRLGNLPGIRGESGPTARATLTTYVNHYLEEEIRREALARDLGPFAVFLRLAAIESGRQVNLTALSQESGIALSTIRTYYQLLVDTLVGYWVGAYTGKTRKRLLTTARFLFFDVGVRNAAAEVALDGRLSRHDGGPLLEQWVGLELLARAGYFGPGHRLSFWRTTYGVEVDWIWETPREDVPIEVKWTDRPQPRDARHVEKFLSAYPGRAKRGFVVCRCPQAQQLTDRVRAVPWDRL